MSHKTKRLLGSLVMIFAASLVIISCMIYDNVSVLAAPSSSNQKIYELEKDLEGAKTEANKLKQQIQKSKAQQLSYQTEINQLDGEISILTQQLTLIENLSTAWTEDMEEIEKDVAELEDKMENEVLAFESMLRMSYQYGTDTYFNLIFGSEDIGDFLSRSDLIGYHLKANDNIVSGLSDTITTLEGKKAQQQTSLEKIESYGTQQEQIKKELDAKSETARIRKEQLHADEVTMSKELAAKNAEMADMEASIKKLYQESLKNGSIQPWDGKTFYVPTTNYRISSEFTSRISPITGKRENHNGIDFAAPGGTNIYAAADGTVIDSRYSNSWGNVIQIDHGSGIVTLYAHCSYRGVSKGQTVTRGQVIARVGTTGWSTGNHLHFTVYSKGVAQNPRNYLPANI